MRRLRSIPAGDVSLALAISVVILGLAACAGNGSQPRLRDNLKVHLEVPSSVEYGADVPLKFRIENVSQSPVALWRLADYGYQYLGVTITRAGTDVQRWPCGKDEAFASINKPIARGPSLQPGEVIEETQTWRQEDYLGVPVAPGTYTLQGFLRASLTEHSEDVETVAAQSKRELTILPPANGAPVQEKSLASLVKAQLEAPSKVPQGFAMPLRLKVSNISGGLLTLYTGLGDLRPPAALSSANSDFAVTKEGELLWTSSCGKFVEDVLVAVVFQPGEMKVYEAPWDQRDGEGKPVPLGSYTLRGSFKAGLSDSDPQRDAVYSEPLELRITRKLEPGG